MFVFLSRLGSSFGLRYRQDLVCGCLLVGTAPNNILISYALVESAVKTRRVKEKDASSVYPTAAAFVSFGPQ